MYNNIEYTKNYKKRGVGINIPFNAKGVFSINYNTVKALKNNIINYFLTNPGERYDNPTYGGGLRRFIFEQLTNKNIDEIDARIRENFRREFPVIKVKDIEIQADIDNNKLILKIKYEITGINEEDEINLTFN